MFSVCVIAVLCLVPLSHSAPLACEDLVRPLDQLDPHHLEGRWTLVLAGLGDPSHLEHFKSRESAAIYFANTTEPSKLSFKRAFGFNNSCQYLHSNISLEGNHFIMSDYNFTVTFLYTSCPDCLMTRFKNESKKVARLYLFSRRREVGQQETEEFTAQTKCLNMIPPVAMDPTKELCPEQVSSTEEKTEGQKA